MRAGSGIVRKRGCLKTRSDSDYRVFGISPCGKGIKSLGGDNIHTGHGEICFLSQALHNTVKFRRLGTMHGKHNFVAEPIATKTKPTARANAKTSLASPPRTPPTITSHC